MRYIILLIILLVLLLSSNTYNEYYVNDGYITVNPYGGLNNRLRVILSYLYKANIENKKLKIIWDVNEVCNDKFENLFEDIPNVEIIYNKIEHDYHTCFEDNKDYIKNNYYDLLKPISIVQESIDNTIKLLNNNYIACHIRRTDSIGHPSFKHNTDEDYINFINQYDTNLKIYIATDNRDTQDIFVKKYGDRYVVKLIEPNNNLRQTSVRDAVVDLFVCVNAKYFLGTFGSSFSDTIYQMRNEENIFIN